MVHHYAKAIGVAVYQRCGFERVGLFFTADHCRTPPTTADHLKTTVDHLKTTADHLKASRNAFYSLRYYKFK
jgi:hypothetical protein